MTPKLSTHVLVPDEWRLYRTLRLASLAESPDAFGETLERAAGVPESTWHERLSAAIPDTDLPLLAMLDGRPAGLCWGRRDPARASTVRLYQMWVAPECRGRGAGARLLATAVDWALALGARQVELSVMSGNAAAEALYRAAGFVAHGEPVPLREGATLLEQRLRLDLS